MSSAKANGADRFVSTIPAVDNHMMDVDPAIEDQQPPSPSKHKGDETVDHL